MKLVLFGICMFCGGLRAQNTSVTVPGSAQIALAGQPAGTTVNGDTAPLNAPVPVSMGFSPGQAFSFVATGLVGLSGNIASILPNGTNFGATTPGANGIASIRASAGALVGVFLSDQVSRSAPPPDVDFLGAAQDIEVVAPLLQQPFFIGSGLTSQGTPKTFVAPDRATRLLLGIASSESARNTGSFKVTATIVTIPVPAGNVVRVLGTTQIALAGQPSGTTWNGDTAPPNAPTRVPAPVAAGQGFAFNARGLVGLNGNSPGITADGTTYAAATGDRYGIGGVRAAAGSLIGIFLGDQLDRNAKLPSADFTGAAREQELTGPLLQQPFLIGSGLTSEGKARTFVAPARATSLFLGIAAAQSSANTGFFDVSVAVVAIVAPPGNPVRVLATSQLALAGQPIGASWNGDTSPPASPSQTIVPFVSGQGLKITATGLIGINGNRPNVLPDGGSYTGTTGGSGGIGYIRAAIGSLIGVFLSDQFDPNAKPPDVDYTGGAKDAPQLAPLLQQPFLIGGGKTSDGVLKTFIVPTRATRLMLGIACSQCASNNGTFLVTVSPDGPLTPLLPQTGAISGIISGAQPFSPGSVISIFGANLSSSTTISTDLPLPSQLGDTQVLFDTTAAPLLTISPTQIDVQIPFELNSDSVQMAVVRGGAASIPLTIKLAPYHPTVLTVDGRFAICWNSDTGKQVSPSQPAAPGANMVMYATGLGPVSPAVPSGSPGPMDGSALVTTSATVVFSNAEVPATAGLAPGLIGLYQVAFAVPVNTPSGITPLQLKVGGVASAIAELFVQ